MGARALADFSACARRTGAARGEGEGHALVLTPQRRFLQARGQGVASVPYQRMIRALVDAYAEKQAGK